MRQKDLRRLRSVKAKLSTTRAAIRLLLEIWDYEDDAFTFLCTRRIGSSKWSTHPIKGNRKEQLKTLFRKYPASKHDIYFCPNAFDRPQRKREFALPTPLGWIDIDNFDPSLFKPAPNFLWETSPGRFQGIWIWRRPRDATAAERHSRNLLLQGGDQNGWSVTKALRVPGTTNHKPQYNAPPVRLLEYDPHPRKLGRALKGGNTRLYAAPIVPRDMSALDPFEVMRRYRRRMGVMAGSLMTAQRMLRADRSACVFQIAAALMDAGASDEEVACVLPATVYFESKWGRDLSEAFRQVTLIRARKGQF